MATVFFPLVSEWHRYLIADANFLFKIHQSSKYRQIIFIQIARQPEAVSSLHTNFSHRILVSETRSSRIAKEVEGDSSAQGSQEVQIKGNSERVNPILFISIIYYSKAKLKSHPA